MAAVYAYGSEMIFNIFSYAFAYILHSMTRHPCRYHHPHRFNKWIHEICLQVILFVSLFPPSLSLSDLFSSYARNKEATPPKIPYYIFFCLTSKWMPFIWFFCLWFFAYSLNENKIHAFKAWNLIKIILFRCSIKDFIFYSPNNNNNHKK